MRSGAVLAGVLALTAIGSGMAVADPSPAGFRTYAAVGSGTTQDVWNGLTNGTGAPMSSVASYDAVGSSTIQTKSGGPSYTRPNGPENGVLALSASLDPAFHFFNGTYIAGQVDFARSSSGPANPGGTDLTYMPFARDAVSLAIKSTAGTTASVTTWQLADIYNCVSGANTITVGSTVITVNPRLPLYGSETRAFFLKAIGVTTPGACVTQGGTENDGTVLSAQGDIIPFSAAQWIAQKNGVVINTVSATDLTLASINGSASTTGTAPNLAPGALYGSATVVPGTGVGTFARDTYNVIGTGSLGTSLETTIINGVKSTRGKSIISVYGFLNLGYVGNSDQYRIAAYEH